MIFDFILNFFKKLHVSDIIAKILQGGVTDDLKKYGTIAVVGLQKIREGINDPHVKDVTDTLPGDWDIKTKDSIQIAIDKTLPKMATELDCFSKGSPLEIFKCTLSNIEGKELSEKTVFYTNLAFQIGVELFNTFVGKAFNFNALFLLIPTIYTQLFGKKTADLQPLVI